MGIPWYFYTIYKKYNTENDLSINPETIKNSNLEYMFLDYNSMIHPCAQQALNLMNSSNKKDTDSIEDDIISNCIAYTRYILNVVKPSYLYIMIDGVAPRAKINQQRERRYKSHFFKFISNVSDKDKVNEDFDKDQIVWNSNKITPGTNFMDKLITSLNEFKKTIVKDCHSFLKDIIISDSNDPGEGEHKMMKVIDTLPSRSICIYGLDADLIMLSLINSRSDNIVLIRDNTFNTKLQDADRTFTYLNIKKLKEYVCKDLRLNIDKDITNENLIYDYVFLCFLLGNDFLENVPSLLIKEGGVNVIVKYYTLILKDYNSLIDLYKLRKGDIESCINTNMLRDLFYHLSKTEDFFFRNVYSVYKKEKSCYRDTYDLEVVNSSDNNIFIYKDDIVEYNKSGYKSRHYKFYGVTDLKNCCKDYIIGLYWILGYYNNHCHNNWSWYYDHHTTPFASDIFDYLDNSKSQNLRIRDLLLNSEPIKPLEQLLMVLPKESLLEIIETIDKDLHRKFIRIFNTASVELSQFYPDTIYLDMINKEYLWQSKVFLRQFNNQIINIFL
jgi:5'-3' exoribonuclease 1